MLSVLSVLSANRLTHGLPMSAFYRYCGISRQGYYQGLANQLKTSDVVDQLTDLVEAYRKDNDRRAGLRSLYYNLSIKSRFNLGVNKFERLMRQAGLSLGPMRIRVVTTRSDYQSWNYPNLAKGLIINDINKLVVGDLTMITLGKDRYYLFCLVDVYSCRIVGARLSETMKAQEARHSLRQWVSLRGETSLAGCIHHTDGGSQYFSKLYLADMRQLKLAISVAKNCLENGYAEQRNGLIKHHLIPTMKLASSLKGLRIELDRVIGQYNNNRKQQALGWRSPVEFEQYWEDKEKRPPMTLK